MSDDMTLPPEMLPRSEAHDAEVVVCLGPPLCAGDARLPCKMCIRISRIGADRTEEAASSTH